MNVTQETVDLPQLRLRLFTPVGTGTRLWPAVIAYSDIFQHTGPHLRMCTRIASYGHVVIAPELYGRIEPAGVALRFEEDRQRALDDSNKMQLQWFDDDIDRTLGFATSHASIDPQRLLACGWCIGGHLAFRAALDARVRATVCCYATGLHNDTLGAANGSAKSLEAAKRIKGELMMIWGSRDPHIPAEGRATIHRRLAEAGLPFQTRTYDAEHTFMRDEGARYEPVSADRAFADLLSMFQRFA
ncbi:MAG: dienelactone hydrolase family protein [Myxococcaceae bacterium]